MLHGMGENQKMLLTLQDVFKKEYGTFDIDINSGEINYKDEQTDKKD